MERIIDRNGKKRRITIMAIPGILLLFVIGVLGYGFCIYNGYLLLNNPSKKQYPVSGIDLSHYQGEVDWPVLAQQNIMFAYIKATEGSSHTVPGLHITGKSPVRPTWRQEPTIFSALTAAVIPRRTILFIRWETGLECFPLQLM